MTLSTNQEHDTPLLPIKDDVDDVMSATMCATASATTIPIPIPLPCPISGQADWRQYRCFQLANGVTVCVVHDPESKTTAAAATVNAGAAMDPREMSGLARECCLVLVV